MSENVHATCVALRGRAVLLTGASGVGKSDLALRLIDRGWSLVSDDRTLLDQEDAALVATPPATIAGRIEVRGLGIVTLPHLASAPVALLVRLGEEIDRLPPDDAVETVAGVDLPLLRVDARSPSAPVIVEWALERLERE
ncbi:aldolase [Sphingomicrobium sp. XHP0239]|uniref:HPr kinase/phosphorylase n=1 Tax=Sphingomicrobium maritimum TaxID=3133972 RepID=UPI0031CC671C